jgi:hypothetical protein
MFFSAIFCILLSAIRSPVAESVNLDSFPAKYTHRNLCVILVLLSSGNYGMQLRIRHRSPAWRPGKAFFKPADEFLVNATPS